MLYVLHPHPESPCAAVSAVEVDVSRGIGGDFRVCYYVRGDLGRIVPPVGNPKTNHRADELWQHTCFEAFVKPETGEAYWEFNIAPTGDWQVYTLSGYRQGRRAEAAISPPAVEDHYDGNQFELRSGWRLDGVLPIDKPWKLGLCAVVAEKSGSISYWALQHAPGKPDFHHANAFACTVAP